MGLLRGAKAPLAMTMCEELFAWLRFQIAQQAVKGFFLGVVILPIAEVTNVARAPDVCRPRDVCVHHCFVEHGREKDTSITGASRLLISCSSEGYN